MLSLSAQPVKRAIERYEQIFGIVQGYRHLDERRFRVLAKINAQLPFSIRRLRQQLATLCGDDGYKLEVNGDVYTLTVKVALTANVISRRSKNCLRTLFLRIWSAQHRCCTTREQIKTASHMGRAEKAHLAKIKEEVLPDGANTANYD